jgi:hypothetical protein
VRERVRERVISREERSELRDLRALRGDKFFDHEAHEGRGAKEEAVSYGEDV